MKPVDILVVDDHKIVHEGIVSMLNDQDLVGNIDYCPSLASLKTTLRVKHYDLLILDINLAGENALDAIDEINFLVPNVKIIALTSYDNQRLVQQAKDLDIDGYLLKNTTKKLFISTIWEVLNGKKYFHSSKSAPADEFSQSLDSFANKSTLSKREQELVGYLTSGLNESEIAEKLFISRHTVRTHKKNIFKKLNVHGVMGLIRLMKGDSH